MPGLTKKKGGFHRIPPGEPGHVYSYTQISMYLRCSMQYQFRYMEGKKSPPGIALVEGSSHHEALAYNNLRKMRTGKDVKPKTHIDKFMSHFEKMKFGVPADGWGSTNEDEVVSRARGIIKVYHEQYAPEVKPRAVEKRYTVKIGGVSFLCIVDLEMDGKNGRAMRDYKVVARRSSAGEAESNLQLTVYSIATEIDDVGLVQLLKLKNPAVHELTSSRTIPQKRHAVRIIKGVVEGIKKGVFGRCDPSGWLCNARFCGYYHECLKIKKKVSTTGINLEDMKKKARKKGM